MPNAAMLTMNHASQPEPDAASNAIPLNGVIASTAAAQRRGVIYTKLGTASVEDADSETESINSPEVVQHIRQPAPPIQSSLPPLSGTPTPANLRGNNPPGLGRSEGHNNLDTRKEIVAPLDAQFPKSGPSASESSKSPSLSPVSIYMCEYNPLNPQSQ